jgi:hypothetical protein
VEKSVAFSMIEKLREFFFGKRSIEDIEPPRSEIVILEIHGDLDKLGDCSYKDEHGLALVITAVLKHADGEQHLQYVFNGYDLTRLADNMDIRISTICEDAAINNFIGLLRASKITRKAVNLPFTIML